MRMRVRIGKDGSTRIEVEGGTGKNCLVFTQALEERLGKVTEREMRPESVEDEVMVQTKAQVQEGGF